MVIEKTTTHADGSETHEDIVMDEAYSVGTLDTEDECYARMQTLDRLYNQNFTTDKQTFLLGYKNGFEGDVTQFEDVHQAVNESEEWVRIKANSLDIALSLYDECHELIKEEGYHHNGVLITDDGELEILYSSF